VSVKRDAENNAPVTWLERPVPLWPHHSRVLVHGIAWDADQAVRHYWRQLGRAAAAGRVKGRFDEHQ
jgi:hypothetical protein